jgi:hypothetical protein
MFRGGDDGERVAHVEFADEVHMKLRGGNLELARGRAEPRCSWRGRSCSRRGRSVSPGKRHVEQRREVHVIAVAEQQAVARDEPDEMTERVFCTAARLSKMSA